jgi:NADPH:quinone reductase-like Zn-dependent oxidoreductase
MTVQRLEVQAFGGPDVVQWVQDEWLPEPGVGEVRIRVEASSLAFTDVLIRRNLYPVLKLTLPLTLGYDVVGHIDGVGPGVTRWRVGDRVADLIQVGGNATHLVRPATSLVAVPQGLKATQVEPLILSYVTAYQALFREGKAQAGDAVLIHGASGAVGLAALDLCRAFGVRAVGVASAKREQAVTRMGAAFVAYDQVGSGLRLDRLSRELGGFAVVLDAARGEALSAVMRRLAPSGRLVVLGFSAAFRAAHGAGKSQPGPMARLGFVFSFLRIKSMSVTPFVSQRVVFYDIAGHRTRHPERFQDDLTTLMSLLEAGRIAPHVQRVFGMDEAVEAHRLIEAGQVEGRIVLDLTRCIARHPRQRHRHTLEENASLANQPAG